MLTAPGPITRDHDLSRFSCGRRELDQWLLQHALLSHGAGHAKTQVVVETDLDPTTVVALYLIRADAGEGSPVGGHRQLHRLGHQRGLSGGLDMIRRDM